MAIRSKYPSFLLVLTADGHTDGRTDGLTKPLIEIKTAVFTAHLEISMGRNEVGLG